MSHDTPNLPAPVAVRVFNDIKRVFEDGIIDPAEVVDIAVRATALPPAAKEGGLLAYRIGLGPGKWAYVDAAMIAVVRRAVEDRDAKKG